MCSRARPNRIGMNRGEAVGDGISEDPGPRSCSKSTNLFRVHVQHLVRLINHKCQRNVHQLETACEVANGQVLSILEEGFNCNPLFRSPELQFYA